MATFGVFAATAALVLAAMAMIAMNHSLRTNAVVSTDDATADALARLLDDSSSDVDAEFDEWSNSDDSVSSLAAPEWLLTAVDLDAAAAEEHPENGSDNDTGVY